MRFTLSITIALLILSIDSFSQTDRFGKRIKPKDIETQGDQEKYWAQEAFDKKGKDQDFERYKDEITVINNKNIKYDNNVIVVWDTTYRPIFEKGIIYPSAFRNNRTSAVIKNAKEPDSLTIAGKIIFHSFDTLKVGYIEELGFLSELPSVKRFKLYLWEHGLNNPLMYVFELTNETATKTTDWITFVNGSKLTFLKFISLLI